MKHVLLVEDNWSDARTVERALRKVDPAPDIVLVDSAEEARNRLLHKCAFDLVFLDLHVNGEKGIDLLAWIRERYDRDQLPIVILSGSDFGESIKEAYCSGASAYLLKQSNYSLNVEQIVATYKFWTEVALHLPAAG